jgi:hypothetical protein
MDLHAQALKGRVAIGQRRGHVAHLLRCGFVGAMRQHARAGAQRDEAPPAPFRLGRHRRQQAPGAFALVFLLDGAAVELRLAQDPAAVGADQEALDQPLCVDVGEGRVGDGLVDVDAGQQRGHLETLGTQLPRTVAPLAVLPALACAGAGKVLGRQHAAIATEPLDGRERAARVVLHLGDPAPLLRRSVAAWRRAAGGPGGRTQ